MFEEGNQYWKIRSKDGKDADYNPEQLLQKANEYFDWCINNPLTRMDFKGKDADKVIYDLQRPFTIQGLCVFADISTVTFYNYEKKNDYINIISRIRDIIYSQKYEGAAVGNFNHNIIARDLGLVDKKEQNIKLEQPLFPEE